MIRDRAQAQSPIIVNIRASKAAKGLQRFINFAALLILVIAQKLTIAADASVDGKRRAV
jgi:hypothetical protein